MLRAADTITMVATFCMTMNTRESVMRVLRRKVPLTTSMGRTREMIAAGTAPDTPPASSTMTSGFRPRRFAIRHSGMTPQAMAAA